MKTIHLDIIHPANVHYFKHAIRAWKGNGYQVIVTCRKKEITYQLLDLEKIPFIPMGKNPKSIFGKALFLLVCEWKIFRLYLKNKPSIAISFASSYVAHMAKLFGLPHIAFDDTEHASLNRKLYLPFTDLVLNPESYLLDLGKKQFKFKGHMELFYLNTKHFRPNPEIWQLLNLTKETPYIFFRFVSWGALHDQGQMGFSDDYKIKMVKTLAESYPVFISSEGDVPKELERYLVKIQPNQIHHLLHYCSLCITEGATMASECAALGTSAIYVNSLDAGTLQKQAEDGLIENRRYQEGVIELAFKILAEEKRKKRIADQLEIFNQQRYNLTDFLVWLVEEYPSSKSLLLNQKINLKEKFSIA